MPNGSYNWVNDEYPKLEQYFGQIASVLNRFSEQHNLCLEKYYHQSPNWTFLFRHPKKGIGQIFVHMKDSSHVGIAASWQIFDYQNRSLSDKHTELVQVELDGKKIFSCLEKSLLELLNWDKSELRKDDEVFEDWSQVSEEEFYKRENSYPFPKIE